MADSFDQFELLMREQVSPAAIHLDLPEDDIGWSIMQTMSPVTSAGKDTHNAQGSAANGYFAEWRVRVQRGGLVTGGTFGDMATEQMGADNHLYTGSSVLNPYPDPALAALRSYVAIRMALKRIQGVYAINKDQITARLSKEPIEDVVGDVVEDITSLVRGLAVNYLYGDGSAMVAQVNSSSNITLTKGSSTAVPVDVGTAFRFVVGQRYVAGSLVSVANYGSSARTVRGGTAADPHVFRCVDIDTDTRQPYFETEPGSAANVVLQDNDAIMLAGTYDFTAANVAAGTKAAQGFESLLISSGNFPGAVHAGTAMSVTNHRYLKSYVVGDEDNRVSPAPEIIAEVVDKITDASKQPPNAVIGEQSLWTLFSILERQAFAQYPVPQGQQFQANGSVSAPRIAHGTTTFAKFSSPRVREGSIIGLATDTWKKFVPFGDQTIHWLYSSGAMAGTSSVFFPVFSGRQGTAMAQAPFDFYIEFACTDPRRNFRRVGLHSQRSMSGGS